MDKIFLAIVGVAYLGLALWCAVMPERTSRSIGFALDPGSGQSEYLVVYGGLQTGLALAFLWPLYKPEDVGLVLALCLLVHGCLVLFRTISFIAYSGIGTTTFYLAGVEWAIFLGAAFFYWRRGS